MNRTTLFSVGLLIAFFLPWVDVVFVAYNGYSLPIAIDKFKDIAEVGKIFDINKKVGDVSILKLSYILYLIPIFCIVNIIRSFNGQKRLSYLLNEFNIGLLSVLLLYAYLMSIDVKSNVLSVGYYLTAAFSLIGLFLPNSIIQKDNNKTATNDTTSVDNTNVLNQLTQLHSLKEKGVITEEIYEKERAAFLKQLDVSETNTSTQDTTKAELVEEVKVKTQEEIDRENEIQEQQKIADIKYKKSENMIVKIVVGLIIAFVIFRVIQVMLK